MSLTLVALLWTLFSTWTAEPAAPAAEVYFFEIHARGKKVGELKSTRTEESKAVIYTNRANIETKFLKTFHIFYENENIFKGSKLVEANVINKVNGETRTWTRLKLNGSSNYIFYDQLEEKQHTISESIRFSVVKLHFREPVGIRKVFSEKNGEFHEIYSIGNHQYEKVNGNKKDIYAYKNGRLAKAELDAGLFTMELIAK